MNSKISESRSLIETGQIMLELDHHDQAIENFEKAVKISPEYGDSWFNLGKLRLMQGRQTEAEELFKKAIILEPRNLHYFFNLVWARKFNEDDTFSVLENYKKEIDSFDIENQISLYFSLGKILKDLGQVEESFNNLLLGNSLKRSQIEYNEKETFSTMDEIRKIFNQDFIQSRKIDNSSKLPIFIVGMPRCGSTLVEQALASHPSIFGAQEIYDFSDSVNNIFDTDLRAITSCSETQLKNVSEKYVNRLLRITRLHRRPNVDRITDKMLDNFYFIGLIYMIFPNAKIIHIKRNPIDTCLSCFSTILKQSYSYDLGELGRYYKKYQELMNHWKKIVPNILEIEYESLIKNFQFEIEKILNFCEIEWNENCLNFFNSKQLVRSASMAQVRRPLYTPSNERPNNKLIQPLIDNLDI